MAKLITLDLQRLREAIADDDPDWGWEALTAVAAQIDTPVDAKLPHVRLLILTGETRIADVSPDDTRWPGMLPA